jgi:hypothetical protein
MKTGEILPKEIVRYDDNNMGEKNGRLLERKGRRDNAARHAYSG